MRTSFRKVEMGIRYGRDKTVVDAYLIGIGELIDKLVLIFDMPLLPLPLLFSVVSSLVPSGPFFAQGNESHYLRLDSLETENFMASSCRTTMLSTHKCGLTYQQPSRSPNHLHRAGLGNSLSAFPKWQYIYRSLLAVISHRGIISKKDF
jgi:hypothetical protein